MIAYLCLSLLIIASVNAQSKGVMVQLRNEFTEPLTLVSSSLTVGSWATAPPQSIAPGNFYVNVFSANAGNGGAQGTVTYSSGPRAQVVIFFTNIGSPVYNISVNPPPWIGGIGQKKSTPQNDVFQYWVHQMCLSSAAGCFKKH